MIKTIFVGWTIIVSITALFADGNLPDFSSYSQTESFRDFAAFQTNAEWHLQHSNILAMTIFSNSDSVARRQQITEGGLQSEIRSVYNLAEQNSQHQQLSNEQLKAVRSALEILPLENATPPVNRLVMVSYRKDTNWITRTYDAQSLPDAMTSIFATIDEAKGLKFNPRTKPPLDLQAAYILAKSALGVETNEYYCVSTSCLNPLPNYNIGGSFRGSLGWTFEFSNTNALSRHVRVYFDGSTSIVGRNRGFGD